MERAFQEEWSVFESILYPDAPVPDGDRQEIPEPGFFKDLNLDQVFAAVTAGRDEYALVSYFRLGLSDEGAIRYRQEIFRDVERPEIASALQPFAQSMRKMRDHLRRSDKLREPRQKEGWFLEAADEYVRSVAALEAALASATPSSQGLTGFRAYLNGYVRSKGFSRLEEGARRLKRELSAVRYGVLVTGLEVEVRRYLGEPDYGREIEATFERFSQGGATEILAVSDGLFDMNYVEGEILNGVAYLNHAIFTSLSAYRQENLAFADPVVARFDREIQFYIAYLDHIRPLKDFGLVFNYPEVSRSGKVVCAEEVFDLALAAKLAAAGQRPVGNDFRLDGPERMIVVSGPNQGGKTTFARTFGQLHYLASLGCPVPGSRARLFLPDRVFTHFEREERMASLRGKLEDDIARLHEILTAAAPDSVLIFNELFTSTSFQDAAFLSRKAAEIVLGLDALCVWVTFIDELSRLGPKTVSYVSQIALENPEVRTFKVVRKAADGLAYALSVAEKYRLTYPQVKERVQR